MFTQSITLWINDLLVRVLGFAAPWAFLLRDVRQVPDLFGWGTGYEPSIVFNFPEKYLQYNALNALQCFGNVGAKDGEWFLQVLQCICKTCSRVMLKREEQDPFRRKFRNVKMDKAQKLIAFRKLVAKCKLVKNCPYCGEINGAVKKAGGVYKILHDKFKGRSHQLAKEDFANAIVYNDQIESLLTKVGRQLIRKL